MRVYILDGKRIVDIHETENLFRKNGTLLLMFREIVRSAIENDLSVLISKKNVAPLVLNLE